MGDGNGNHSRDHKLEILNLALPGSYLEIKERLLIDLHLHFCSMVAAARSCLVYDNKFIFKDLA